jgi:hypothetical protein
VDDLRVERTASVCEPSVADATMRPVPRTGKRHRFRAACSPSGLAIGSAAARITMPSSLCSFGVCCRVWLSQAGNIQFEREYHHKSASETSGPQSASMGPKLVSAQRTRCDRGGKARNIGEKCQSTKQKGAATVKN